jgi:hypothetical protein
MTWVGLVLLTLPGFMLGGVVSAWRRSQLLAGVLAIGAALAAAGGIAWLL